MYCATALLLLWCLGSAMSRLNFVSLLYGNIPAVGYMAMIPGMEVALERSSLKYPQLFSNYSRLHQLMNFSLCQDNGAIYPILAELYSEGKLTAGDTNVILYSACMQQFSVVGDFAREMDIVVIPCNAEDATLTDRKRFPTALSFAPGTVMAFGRALTALMDRLHWRSIAVINDYRTEMRYWGRSKEQCRGFLEQLKTKVGSIDSLEIPIMQGGTYVKALNEAKAYSRIILCCTLGATLKQLLATAYDMDMVAGDFVYVYPFESQVPGEPPLAWSDSDGTPNLLAAFHNLWLIRSAPPDWQALEPYLLATLSKRQELYPGAQASLDTQRNEFMLACMRAVETTSDVLHNLTGHSADSVGGTDLVRKMAGRRYQTVSGEVALSTIGTQEIRIHIQYFDMDRKDFRTVLIYDTHENGTFEDIGYSLLQWKLGRVPPDRPICGIRDEHCTYARILTQDLPGGICGAVSAIFLVVGALWWRHKMLTQHEQWWLVLDTEVEKRRVTSRASSRTSTFSHLFPSFVFGRLVWVKGLAGYPSALPVSQPFVRNKPSLEFQKLMQQMRNLNHANVNKLIGMRLRVGNHVPELYEEFCSKGGVDDLLLVHSVDDEFKFSLIKDCISGIRYIHKSFLRQHGHLKLSKCLVDRRLTLKISDVGYEVMGSVFTGRKPPERKPTLYAAPELNRRQSPTPPGDLYAFAALAFQIFTKMELFDPYEVTYENAEKHRIFLLMSLSRDEQIPVALVQLLRCCLNETPSLRPTALEAKRTVAELAQANGVTGTLFDCVSRRLQKYAEVLEEQVEERQRLLISERKRCEHILCEMLPKKIVRILRVTHCVDPEYFDEVTLFMGTVCGFAELTAFTDPGTLVGALTGILEMYDCVFRKYRVYEVEVYKETCMIASGLPRPVGKNHVFEIGLMALELQASFLNLPNANVLQFRAGVHTGPVAAGVIGLRRPRYCLFGDTVNTASRLETTGLPSKTHASQTTMDLGALFGLQFEERGVTFLKGKGSMKTYWLLSRER